MYLNQLRKEIETYFDIGLTVELQSPPGVGKSDWVENLAAELSERDGFEWGYGRAFLGTYTPIDLMGYMIPVKKKVMVEGVETEIMVSEYTLPPWFFAVDGRPLNSFKKAILLMDEYGQGEPDVKKTAADLRLHKRIGPHQLADSVNIICASNRAKDRSGVTKSFDFEINRVAYLNIEPDFASWEAWASKQRIEPIFILFARKYPNLIFNGEVPKDQGPFCTPRSYVAAVKMIRGRAEMMKRLGIASAGNYGFADQNEGAVVQEQLNGIIGEAASVQMAGWMRMRLETPDYADIVKDPKGVDMPSKPDAKMLVCYECAYHVKSSDMAPVIEFIKRMPPEFHVTFAKTAVKRDHRLLVQQDMHQFIKGNTALLNAIG